MPYRTQNPAACVAFMKQAVEDPDLYWFGNQMNQICFDQPIGTENVTCNNARPDGYDQSTFLTLGSRVFLDDQFSTSRLLQDLRYPLTVTYTSPREIYSGCNSSAFSAQEYRVDINPNMQPLPAFYFRSRPVVTPPPGCDQDNLCAVFFFDVAYSLVHNIWVNWPRDNPPDLPYLPTAPASQEPTPYAWLVFRQANGPINYEPSPEILEKGYPFFGFELQNFMQQFGLQGPVAMTWLLTHTDIRALWFMDSIGAPGTPVCPALLEQALRRAPNSLYQDLGMTEFRSPQPNEKREIFSIWLNVKYSGTTISTSQYVSSDNLLWLDPIKNGMLNAKDAEKQPQVFVTPRGFPPNRQQLFGKTFTLLMVHKDLTAGGSLRQPLYQYPSGYQQYQQPISNEPMVVLHWFLANIQGNVMSIGYTDPVNGDITGLGEEFLPYLGVASPGSQNVYFLLYEQGARLSSNQVSRLFNLKCGSDTLKYRCQFPLQRFVRENQLKLAGMSRFRTSVGIQYGYTSG